MLHRTSGTRNDYEQKINYNWHYFILIVLRSQEVSPSVTSIM